MAFIYGFAAGSALMLTIIVLIKLIIFGEGVLLIDTTDPKTDKYRFVIRDLMDLKRKRYILLEMKHTILDDEEDEME